MGTRRGARRIWHVRRSATGVRGHPPQVSTHPSNGWVPGRWAFFSSLLTPDGHPAVLASLLKGEARPDRPERTALREKGIPAPRAPRPVDAIPRKRVYAHGQRRRTDVGPPSGFLECPDEGQNGRYGEEKAQPVNPSPQDDPLESLDLSFGGLHLASSRVGPTNPRSLIDFFKRHGGFPSRLR